MKKTEQQLEEIISKLDLVVKLMSINTLEKLETNRDKIVFLYNLGFSSSQIISISDIPNKTVYNVISGLKKSGPRSYLYR